MSVLTSQAKQDRRIESPWTITDVLREHREELSRAQTCCNGVGDPRDDCICQSVISGRAAISKFASVCLCERVSELPRPTRLQPSLSTSTDISYGGITTFRWKAIGNFLDGLQGVTDKSFLCSSIQGANVLVKRQLTW